MTLIVDEGGIKEITSNTALDSRFYVHSFLYHPSNTVERSVDQ